MLEALIRVKASTMQEPTRRARPADLMAAQKSNPKVVFVAVVGVLALAGLPFLSKEIRRREQNVASMRDDSYEAKERGDAKDAARDNRLTRSPR